MGKFKLRAPDPETFMRSRYCAYVMNDLTYLRDTWAPETRPAEIEPTPEDLKWLGMDVKSVENIDEHNAIVHILARYRVAGRSMRMNETCRVTLTKGRWFYLDAEVG